MPLKNPMNTKIEDEKIVIDMTDMADAEQIWDTLSMEQQYACISLLLNPAIERLTAIKRATQPFVEMAETFLSEGTDGRFSILSVIRTDGTNKKLYYRDFMALWEVMNDPETPGSIMSDNTSEPDPTDDEVVAEETTTDQPALHRAVIKGDTSALRIALDVGADVNMRDQYGSTAIHLAAMLGFPACTRALLNAGADPTLKVQGKTPRETAQLFLNLSIAAMLRQAERQGVTG